MSSTNPPTILILGGSFSGVPVAHKLLRSIPAEYKVILVNPSTQIYWNFASPRVLAKDKQFPTVFAPIVPGFAAYPSTRFEFVQGTATSLDPKANTVIVTTVDDENKTGATRTIVYTQLIIATGSSAHDSWPFKPLGPHTVTQAAIKDVQVKVEAAKTIVLSGSGATGVETAGEIATLFKGAGKKIYLLSNGSRVLPMLREDISAAAAKQLESLGVTLKYEVRVTEERELNGGLHLVLSNGETIDTDLHIPTFGLTPNTSFVPADLLDDTRSVKVSPHLQSTVYDNIWATGDVAGVKHKKNMTAKTMGEVTVKNVLATVEGKGKEAFVEHKDEDAGTVIPIGGGFAMGVGIFGGWKVWGFLVWLLKGRGYFIGALKGVAAGKQYAGGQKV